MGRKKQWPRPVKEVQIGKNRKKVEKLAPGSIRWMIDRAKKSKFPLNEMGFCVCIPSDQVEFVLGKVEAKKFWRWMSGQSMPMFGVYPWDMERYLQGGKAFR